MAPSLFQPLKFHCMCFKSYKWLIPVHSLECQEFIKNCSYRIYSAIRRAFLSLESLQITKSVLSNFALIQVLLFLNNPKDLDPSSQTDLDFWDCFGRNKLRLITEEIR